MENYLKLLAVCAATLSVCSASFQANVDLDKSRAQVGGSLAVTCDVHNENKEPFFITWVRRVGNEEVEIGNNDILNTDFKETKRYDAELAYAKPGDISKVSFTLHISNLQSSDNGQIGCRLAKQKIEFFKDFVVEVPIESIRLNSQYQNGSHAVSYNDGDDATFTEGETRKVYCVVSGSYPEPQVKMMIGDQDITDMFEKETELEKGEGKTGLQDLGYMVKLWQDEFTISYDYSGEDLRCVASVPDTEFSNEEQSVGITVKLAGYRPKFMCEQTQRVTAYQKRVNISCRVRSDPAPNDFKFYWQRHNEGNESLEMGQQSGHYTAEVLPGDNDFESLMVLRIDRVFQQHFRKYFFEAANDLGRVTHEIDLKKDRRSALDQDIRIERTRSDGGASSATHTVLSSSALSILIVLLLL